jgi:DMSO/TMAO reductase YedYZ molybdopterin-dependent catalytic subunit/rhodanese-related sulfurtransferase/glyoxylase-like metal-dependent hydrolase (beta-lactamase superfamily II)
MIFTQHYLACLSHASYLVGDESTGRAVVVDPRRDVGVYLDEAAGHGLTIERVIETHVHADFLSGHLELAARTGAVISYGAGADVEFPVEPLEHGRRLSLGEVTLEVLATPGHTPESICIVVYEHADDEEPYGVLTGDTLFVGDVGRPDLLASRPSGGPGTDGRSADDVSVGDGPPDERSADDVSVGDGPPDERSADDVSVGDGPPDDLSADALARRLYHSLHDVLLRLPDGTRVFPAHGAGSSCGKRLSSETSALLGEQRFTNYALQPMTEDEFVALVTEGQPPRPGYFDYDAQRNRQLHPLLDDAPAPLLDLSEVLAARDAGAVLLDVREPVDFAAGHLRGALNAGLQGRFAEWAGEVLTPHRPVVLVGDPALAAEAKMRLARVGYDRVVGQLTDPGLVFGERPDLVETSSRLTIEQFAELRGLEPDLQLVDVRTPAETGDGTLPGAREIPLPVLVDSIGGLDPTLPVVVYCASGYRSQIALSVLRAAGFADVSDLLGGSLAWEAAGLPLSRGPSDVDAVRTPQIGARAARSLVEGGALLVDVREVDEWEVSHAPEAVLVPMSTVKQRRHELPRDRRVVVVCRSGGRSAAVTESLRGWGFDAVNLAGGMCAWAAAGLPVVTPADTGLVVHTVDPLNCETALPELIGGVVMPSARFYVRNHFATPVLDTGAWRLEVGGLVERPLHLGLRDLQNMPSHTLVATLECAGNGRSLFDPAVPGEQWQLGAVSTAEWTGVPLVEVLDRAGIRSTAREIVLRGADRGPVEGGAEVWFERSLSIDDARGSEALLAYAMNGEPLPLQHGHPLRLIVPGWYAVTSVKWLTHIEAVAQPFEGFFQAQRYFYEWEREGTTVREPVRLQQVRALVTEPAAGVEVPTGDLVVRGVAWSGAAPIAGVDVRVGEGSWLPARLVGERRRHSWQWWELLTHVDQPGETTVRARATDLSGRTQPERPTWNRLGYGGNAIQVVPIRIR